MTTNNPPPTDPRPLPAVIVHPGDKVMLVTSGHLTAQHYSDMVDRMRAALPGVEFGIVEGIDQALVYRPDPSDAPDDLRHPDAPPNLKTPSRPNPSNP